MIAGIRRTHSRVPGTLAAVALLGASVMCAVAADPDYRLVEGTASFVHPMGAASEARTVTVWYHRPQGVQADAPVVFVMHGRNRNGQSYRRAWIPHAEAGRFILLVPEFSRAQFGSIREYAFGNVIAPGGTIRPEHEWSFAAVENIFDAVRHANALAATHYDIYGHSGGAQFVHRMVLAMPSARFRVAVAANAGSYAVPNPATTYPYGVGGLDSKAWQAAFGRRLIVLLGEQDTDPDAPALPRAPQAMAQGAHRFARGQFFFSEARLAAARLGIPLNWSLVTTEGAHSNAQMAAAAARFVGHGINSPGGAQNAPDWTREAR
jgi:poly(3-hydroxybutyrate) depolymerase